MNQAALFHEDIWQALNDCVRALGGAKKFGHQMRPEMEPQEAGKWLLDCLNPARKDKLSLEQTLFILREAKDIGCHAGATFIMRDTGYADPVPVDPESAASDLERRFIDAVDHLALMTSRIAELRARSKKRA